MGKITSYPAATEFDSGADVILKDGANGTKKMNVTELSKQLFEQYCGVYRFQKRTMFGATNLGTSFTAAHNEAIATKNFYQLKLGSYWTINGHRYDIVDFDYWYYRYDSLEGNNSENVHHVVLMPRWDSLGLSQKPYDKNGSVDGGYIGSSIYTEGLDEIRALIRNDWGDHVVTHREIFTNAVTDGVPTGSIWVDCDVCLLNAPMLCGSFPMVNTAINHDTRTIDQEQLALFRIDGGARRNVNGVVRDIYNSSRVVGANASGQYVPWNATSESNLNVVFAIKAT